MKFQPLLCALTLVNLGLLGFNAFGAASAAPSSDRGILRGRGLEIVDDRGRLRAMIAVLPPNPKDGAGSETVLLRLITEKGRPNVKIAASEQQSGLSFSGPTGTRQTWVQLGSNGKESRLLLKNEDGREREIRP